MRFSYLAALVISFVGMLILDKKYKLAFTCDARRTGLVLAISVAIFIVWDILGITLGIFYSGNSSYMSGLYVMPDLPIEELVFLTFLGYFTLTIYLLLEKKWRRI